MQRQRLSRNVPWHAPWLFRPRSRDCAARSTFRAKKMSLDAAAVTSTTARLNASSFTLDGLLKPLSLRTNCSAEARISASVAGGSKLNSVLMLRHMSLLHLTQCLSAILSHHVE